MTAESFLDEAPSGDSLTDYDRAHVKLYVRLLDAEADGADWRGGRGAVRGGSGARAGAGAPDA